jgi:hypothetical protein
MVTYRRPLLKERDRILRIRRMALISQPNIHLHLLNLLVLLQVHTTQPMPRVVILLHRVCPEVSKGMVLMVQVAIKLLLAHINLVLLLRARILKRIISRLHPLIKRSKPRLLCARL